MSADDRYLFDGDAWLAKLCEMDEMDADDQAEDTEPDYSTVTMAEVYDNGESAGPWM